MLGTNIVSAARRERQIDAVNRSPAIHVKHVEGLVDHRPAELPATSRTR